jgi:hypothetical protein
MPSQKGAVPRRTLGDEGKRTRDQGGKALAL